MGSKKLRTEKRLEQLKNAPPRPIAKSVPQKPTAIAEPQRPWYTILIMAAAIAVIMFLFNLMLNTFVTDYFLQRHPEYNGDNEALRIAVEAFMKQSSWYIIIQRLIYNFSGVVAIMICFFRLEQEELTVIGLKKNGKIFQDVGMAVLFAFTAVLIVFNLLAAIGYTKLTRTLEFSWYQLLWTVEIAIMCLFEEGFFRGFLGYKLKKYGTLVATVVPALIFTLYKGIPSTMPGTYLTYFVMGAMLSFTVNKLGTMWFSLAFRFVWTFVSGVVLSIYSGLIKGIFEITGIKETLLSGNVASFENGLLPGIILIICFVIIYKMITSRGKRTERRLHSDGTIRPV